MRFILEKVLKRRFPSISPSKMPHTDTKINSKIIFLRPIENNKAK